MTKKTKNTFIIIGLIGLVALCLYILSVFFPWIISLQDPLVAAQFKLQIDSLGVVGYFIIAGLQFLQIVFMFLPGEPIEFVSGMLYGTFGGLILCSIGALVASVLVFYITRKLGRSFVEKILKKESMQKLNFLNDTKKMNFIWFILFFIPGTPKDALVYIAGVTPIKASTFFLITTIARIPSIISSTYAGANFSQGNFHVTIIIYVIITILALFGIYINNKIMKKYNKKNQPE